MKRQLLRLIVHIVHFRSGTGEGVEPGGGLNYRPLNILGRLKNIYLVWFILFYQIHYSTGCLLNYPACKQGIKSLSTLQQCFLARFDSNYVLKRFFPTKPTDCILFILL